MRPTGAFSSYSLLLLGAINLRVLEALLLVYGRHCCTDREERERDSDLVGKSSRDSVIEERDRERERGV